MKIFIITNTFKINILINQNNKDLISKIENIFFDKKEIFKEQIP